VFYGVSKTLDFSEKWNITVECESPAYNSRIAPTPMYFKWIGEQGDQTMFSFNTVMGARIINLPLDGRSPQTVEALYEATGQERAKRLDPAYDKPRATGIVGIRIGPGPEHEAQSTYAGIAKNILIQNLRVDGCETGLGVGGHTYESDTAHIRITDAHISGSAKYGVVVNSTMAVVQMENAVVSDSGISNVRLFGGDLGLLQYCGLGNSKKMVADIELRGGALRVIGAWSETYAPFVRADYKQNYYPNWPRLIAGVVHGSPYGGDASIVYDSPAALNLMGCGFRGDVVAGPKSGPIFAQGVSFGNPIGVFQGNDIGPASPPKMLDMAHRTRRGLRRLSTGPWRHVYRAMMWRAQRKLSHHPSIPLRERRVKPCRLCLLQPCCSPCPLSPSPVPGRPTRRKDRIPSWSPTILTSTPPWPRRENRAWGGSTLPPGCMCWTRPSICRACRGRRYGTPPARSASRTSAR
jgi:hypothetical protein